MSNIKNAFQTICLTGALGVLAYGAQAQHGTQETGSRTINIRHVFEEPTHYLALDGKMTTRIAYGNVVRAAPQQKFQIPAARRAAIENGELDLVYYTYEIPFQNAANETPEVLSVILSTSSGQKEFPKDAISASLDGAQIYQEVRITRQISCALLKGLPEVDESVLEVCATGGVENPAAGDANSGQGEQSGAAQTAQADTTGATAAAAEQDTQTALGVRPQARPQIKWSANRLELTLEIAARKGTPPVGPLLRNCTFSLVSGDMQSPLEPNQLDSGMFVLEMDLGQLAESTQNLRKAIDPNVESDGQVASISVAPNGNRNCDYARMALALPDLSLTSVEGGEDLLQLGGTLFLPGDRPDMTMIHKLGGLTTLGGQSNSAQQNTLVAVVDFAETAHGAVEDALAQYAGKYQSADAYMADNGGFGAAEFSNLRDSANDPSVPAQNLPPFNVAVRGIVQEQFDGATGLNIQRAETAIVEALRQDPDVLAKPNAAIAPDMLVVVDVAETATIACDGASEYDAIDPGAYRPLAFTRLVAVSEPEANFKPVETGPVNDEGEALIWACKTNDKTKTQTYVVPLADVVERRAWTELRESIRRHFHEQLR